MSKTRYDRDDDDQDSSFAEAMLGGPQQQLATVGATAVSARVVAEAQASLMVAAARPRDELRAIQKIKNACQRKMLAEKAEYEYTRGGKDISGATIKLLEAIACYWGNVKSGFRELSRSKGESVVEAFAWDMESNRPVTLEFTVRHIRDKKEGRGGGTPVTSERDIYEVVANQAQRRVRKCLESVIPSDVVDEALEECRQTLKAAVDLTPERIAGMVEKFAALGVTRKQIAKRIQRNVENITPAQFLGMIRIHNSIRDQMSEVSNWFDEEDADDDANAEPGSPKQKPETAAERAAKSKADLDSQIDEMMGGGEQEEAEQESATEPKEFTSASFQNHFNALLDEADDDKAVGDLEKQYAASHPQFGAMIAGMCEDRLKELHPFGKPCQLPLEGQGKGKGKGK